MIPTSTMEMQQRLEDLLDHEVFLSNIETKLLMAYVRELAEVVLGLVERMKVRG